MKYIYDNPTECPKGSVHWESLPHEPGDRYVTNLEELTAILHNEKEDEQINVAFWSTLLGYCEALTTDVKDHQRFNPYPIPRDALQRMLQQEFVPPSAPSINTPNEDDSHHRRNAVRNVANWVWSKVVSKANTKDEKHANSVYTVLRGQQFGKSIDCFGAALVTVLALRRLQQPSFASMALLLSEDHAYAGRVHDGGTDQSGNVVVNETYEVALPGNTKAQRLKRGQDVANTFSNKATTTPETSWLYMAGNAVRCDTNAMLLAAVIANVNCLIDNKTDYERYSEPLLLMKRELLWILYDRKLLDPFPFALCELGWTEEHVTSTRGEKEVSIVWESQPVHVTAMEALYHQAIKVSQTQYNDKQIYPFCYMGYFHKDGGQEEEYRLGLAVQFFAEAARVASTYKYDSGDTLQLIKVFVKVSEFLVNEVLSLQQHPRIWQTDKNAVSCAKWTIIFFDHLLHWEESSGHVSFLPICKANHKTGIARAFAALSVETRKQAFEEVTDLQSQRMQGTLRTALQAPKITLSDMHLTIVSAGGRQRKRKEPV
jgi:hypothetical protein